MIQSHIWCKTSLWVYQRNSWSGDISLDIYAKTLATTMCLFGGQILQTLPLLQTNLMHIDDCRVIFYICEALRNLVPFVQFKKHEKHPWRSVTIKVTILYGWFSCFLNYTDGTKSRNASHISINKNLMAHTTFYQTLLELLAYLSDKLLERWYCT